MRKSISALVIALAATFPAITAAQPLLDGMAAYLRRDYPTAIRDLRPLAEAGDVHAEETLGAMYFFGLGVTKDYTEAARLYRKAADKGSGAAQSNLASMYANGEGVPVDFVQAARLYRLAADQGYDLSADVALAQLYENGQGVPQDDAAAVHWYRLAAEGGLADAQTALGLMYYNGKGVPQDFDLAASWFRKAADQGDADGQTNLGAAYANGKGAPKDAIQAYKWLTLAAGRSGPAEADGRDLASRNRDIVAAKMTAAEIDEAKNEAAAWSPNLAGQRTAAAALGARPLLPESGADDVVWLHEPSYDDVGAAYPALAQRARMSGMALASCALTPDGHLAECKIVRESPPGFGFGPAALGMMRRYQVKLLNEKGPPFLGATVKVPVRWLAAPG